ncbi:MAG: hypothetical protein SCALA702_37170 [Melioribacteraceae bacterium]|nr:MAG: hypothetical protein SCALA702_37170 [Melioribacteraceae bacterium]
MKIHNTKINPFTLYFTPDVESHFNDYHNSRIKKQIRITLLVGIVFYSAFGFLDSFVVEGEILTTFLMLRFFLVLPVASLALLSTYIKSLEQINQPLLALTTYISGSAIIYMIQIAEPPVNYNYYAGLILVFMYGYTFLRIKFVWATLAGWMIVITYEISLLLTDNSPIDIIINNNFFMISANMLGMMSSYAIELFIRREFITRKLLDDAKIKLHNHNIVLSEQVRERTEELTEANYVLKDEIERRKIIEKELNLAIEKAEKADKLKTEFLAQMSHEIRTPINTILNFNSLLRMETEHTLSAELQDSFEIIDNSSKRLIRTIDSILNVSQLQTGNYEVNFQKINLNQLTYKITREFVEPAKSKNIDLNFVASGENSTIYADEYSLTQIILNLLDNALKFTDKGEIKTKIFSSDNYHNLLIQDSGIGINPEYISKIYEPFSQEQTGYTREFDGNGLGLTLVRKYCEINDADIKFSSLKGKGTSVRISFKSANNN